MTMLWEQRTDLQQAFAFDTQQEVDGYIAWCLTDGIAGGHIALEFLDATFWEELDALVALTGVYDDLPITRGLWILHSRSGRDSAVRQFPGERRSRVELALWFAFEAPQKFGWPPALTA